MVEYQADLDKVIKAIADPVRRRILFSLKSGPATVGELAKPHSMTFAGAAKHVNVLVDADLVQKKRVGRQQLCALNAKPMRAIQDWLDSYADFWNDRLDALETAVEEFENDQ